MNERKIAFKVIENKCNDLLDEIYIILENTCPSDLTILKDPETEEKLLETMTENIKPLVNEFFCLLYQIKDQIKDQKKTARLEGHIDFYAKLEATHFKFMRRFKTLRSIKARNYLRKFLKGAQLFEASSDKERKNIGNKLRQVAKDFI